VPPRKHPIMGENYYLFFKPLPIGHSNVEPEVIRGQLEANAPVEHYIANLDIQVVYSLYDNDNSFLIIYDSHSMDHTLIQRHYTHSHFQTNYCSNSYSSDFEVKIHL
jgi:hypothetical protein